MLPLCIGELAPLERFAAFPLIPEYPAPKIFCPVLDIAPVPPNKTLRISILSRVCFRAAEPRELKTPFEFNSCL